MKLSTNSDGVTDSLKIKPPFTAEFFKDGIRKSDEIPGTPKNVPPMKMNYTPVRFDFVIYSAINLDFDFSEIVLRNYHESVKKHEWTFKNIENKTSFEVEGLDNKVYAVQFSYYGNSLTHFTDCKIRNDHLTHLLKTGKHHTCDLLSLANGKGKTLYRLTLTGAEHFYWQ